MAAALVAAPSFLPDGSGEVHNHQKKNKLELQQLFAQAQAQAQAQAEGGGVSLDFEGWTSLISNVELTYHDDIDKISVVYDTFLSEFPLCFGYWNKYAKHMARLSGVESAIQVFERAVEAAPYCVHVWFHYCDYAISTFEDSSQVCRLFERGLSFVGKDYLCCKLWDKYIEFEFSQQHWNSLANIYIQTLKFPTKKLHQYYESFKKLIDIWEEEMECEGTSYKKVQSRHEKDGVVSDDSELSHVIQGLLDPSSRSKALQKYTCSGEHFYQRASDLDAEVQKFEQKICRPYFHVKPLDANQLKNWHLYLDFVEMEGDFDWVIKLYEKCLISCANYPEFWMRYVDYVESKGGREIATDALGRATDIFLKNDPEIHLFSAWIKEDSGDVEGVREAFQKCEGDLESHFMDIIQRKANMERRLGNYVAASKIYKDALDIAALKRHDSLPMLYVNFARLQFMITNKVKATKEVLLDGIRHAPYSTLLLKELILFALMHQGAIKVGTLDSIVAKALSHVSDSCGSLSTKEWENVSRLYLEFIDLCGSIHDVRRAWTRHLKLFPHLVRVHTSLKKPTATGTFWKILSEERPIKSDTRPRNSPVENDGNLLIQLPPPEKKVSDEENIGQSDQAVDVQLEIEKSKGILNDSEHMPSGITKIHRDDACIANDSCDEDVSKSITIHLGQELDQQLKPQSSDNPDDEFIDIIGSPSPRVELPRETSFSSRSAPASGHDVIEVPMVSGTSPRGTNAAERCTDSPSPLLPRNKNPSSEVSPRRVPDREGIWRRLNPSAKGRSDRGSPGNSEDRLERSLSPRRRSSYWYSDDRRHRERSLSPRRRRDYLRHSEDRWHRDRRNRRNYRFHDYSRGQRDGRNQNENQVVVVGNTVQTPNVQQTMGLVTQSQLSTQPIAYPQGQAIQCVMPSNNLQDNQLYNQMWQYYYYNQQQLLSQQQPSNQQPQLQQILPHQRQQRMQIPSQQQQMQISSQQQQMQMQNPPQQQPMQNPPQQQPMQNPLQQQQMQNPLQQPQMQGSQQPQQIHAQQLQLLSLQYQQQMLYQQPQFEQQQQSNEQLHSPDQQVQLQQQIQFPQQQLYLQLQQQVQIQQQHQPQVEQPADVDLQKQQKQSEQCSPA